MKARNTIIVSSDQIVRLNAIIHNQRETLRTLNEDKKILKADNEKLKKKLDIATKALKEYADRENYHDFDDDYDKPIWNIGSPIMHAELALKQIKDLDK